MARDYVDRLVVGTIFSVAGLLVVLFHKSIKEWRDDRKSRDFPWGYGEMWSGKYTKGGLLFTYATIILVGVILFGIGMVNIISAFTG